MKKLLIILLFLPCLVHAQSKNNNLKYTYIEYAKDSTSVGQAEVTVLTADTTGYFVIGAYANTRNPATSSFLVSYTTQGTTWSLWNAAPLVHIKSAYSPQGVYLDKGDTLTITTRGIGLHWHFFWRLEEGH